MPTPNLARDWKAFGLETDRLKLLLQSVPSLEPKHQKLVAEMLIVRLFLSIENTIARTCAKMLCGADYLDGTTPRRLAAAGSIVKARTLMATYGRPKRRHLMWSMPREIKLNINYTIDSNDPLFHVLSQHAQFLTDIRFVRNHVVHNNEGTRVNFRKVVRAQYGGLKRGVTPGLLLLTTAVSTTPLVRRYLAFANAFIRDLLRA